MKVLFKKLKRANKFALFLYILSLLAFITTYAFFTKSLLNLVGIETAIRISLLVLFALWFFTYLLFGLYTMIIKKYQQIWYD